MLLQGGWQIVISPSEKVLVQVELDLDRGIRAVITLIFIWLEKGLNFFKKLYFFSENYIPFLTKPPLQKRECIRIVKFIGNVCRL